ncbi:MAG: hypothetical protein Q9223_003802 [Gallowayella weberi]
MGNSCSKQKYDDIEDEQWYSFRPIHVNRGGAVHVFHPLPHGMVGMEVWDRRFTDPKALKSGPATRGMMKWDDVGIVAPGNVPGVGALGITQTTFPSDREGVSKRRTSTKSDTGPKSKTGRHHRLQGLKEERQETSDSERIEWDMTCEEASKSAEISGQVERDVEKQRMLKETGICPEDFRWNRHRDGWRCQGGHHFVFHNRQLADKFSQWLQTLPSYKPSHKPFG